MENQKSLIEIALEIMEKSNAPLNIYTLIKETLSEKGLDDPDGSLAAKLYTDISISSKFVYMGEDNWDLKSRQSLDQFDKDGSSFISKDEEYQDEDDSEDEDLYDDEDEKDEDEDDEDSEKEYQDEDEDEESDDRYEDEESKEEDNYDDEDNYDEESDESEEDNYDDEDKYNQIMDDYEDLYED